MAKKNRSLGHLLFRVGKRAVFGPLLGPERNWPSVRRTKNWMKRKTRTGTLASFSRDPRSGEMTMRGMRPGADGRLEFGRAPSTPARRSSRPAAKSRVEQRSAQRKAERAQRTGRPVAAHPKTASRRGAGTPLDDSIGTALLGGARQSKATARLTPQQRMDRRMTQLSCDWCRSTNARPVTTGDTIQIVTGVMPCNHTPFPAPGMPAQEPLGPAGLVCPGCENTGGPGGRGCPACQGFIVRWSEFDGIGAMPKGQPRIKKRR